MEDNVAGNSAERERLFVLLARLGEQQLAQPMKNGWTVGTKLLHLAFWDRNALCTLEEWKKSGFKASAIPFDHVNDAALMLSRAIPPAAIGPLVREAAEAVDRAVQTFPRIWCRRSKRGIDRISCTALFTAGCTWIRL